MKLLFVNCKWMKLLLARLRHTSSASAFASFSSSSLNYNFLYFDFLIVEYSFTLVDLTGNFLSSSSWTVSYLAWVCWDTCEIKAVLFLRPERIGWLFWDFEELDSWLNMNFSFILFMLCTIMFLLCFSRFNSLMLNYDYLLDKFTK